jgi:hypothetical protein
MKTNAKLATAFMLGAATTVAIFKARPDKRRPSTRKSAATKSNAVGGSSIEIRLIPGNALEPLNTEVLVKRSIEAFPAGYLLLISIIQSVTLGLLLTDAVALLTKPVTTMQIIAVVSKTATVFGALVIISYEYLWFVVIMRWASTFRDTVIPYAIGVAEIVASLMLGQSISWWIAATVVPVVCGVALFNTITRLDSRAFIDKPAMYQTIRLLLWRIIMCCVAITAIGVTGSILLYHGVLHGNLAALAPLSLILPAFVAVVVNEKSLNSVFASYGITRRPLLWTR